MCLDVDLRVAADLGSDLHLEPVAEWPHRAARAATAPWSPVVPPRRAAHRGSRSGRRRQRRGPTGTRFAKQPPPGTARPRRREHEGRARLPGASPRRWSPRWTALPLGGAWRPDRARSTRGSRCASFPWVLRVTVGRVEMSATAMKFSRTRPRTRFPDVHLRTDRPLLGVSR